LVPPSARLRSRAMHVAPGGAIEWHSTDEREELLLVLSGTLSLEIETPQRRRALRRLAAGAALYLPSRVRHRVRNRSRRRLVYVYVTA
jgi:mannose-6-phosphate isomerase-like protein (cupin superfamily)